MSMAIFSPKLPTLAPHYSHGKTLLRLKPNLFVGPTKKHHQFRLLVSADSTESAVAATAISEETTPPPAVSVEQSVGSNGSPPVVTAAVEAESVKSFEDTRWVGGTWDLNKFSKDGNSTDWDAVIDAEVKRRKWMEDNPQSSSNEDPVVFDTSIIPWWAWMKRFHLPEAELLNGRAAMVGFFMAYFVDSLTGVGLVDQMGNFFCKTLLFVAVGGVLLIRKNEDVEKLKKLIDETTFYDKQWQATWQDDKPSSPGKN